ATEVAGRQRLSPSPRGNGKDVGWQERLPAEGGRGTPVHPGAGGKRRTLLPEPWNARTRVHEYGGLSYLPLPAAGGRSTIMFANLADPRLYLLEPSGPDGRGGGDPRPLTPEPGGSPAQPSLRYADVTRPRDGTE